MHLESYGHVAKVPFHENMNSQICYAYMVASKLITSYVAISKNPCHHKSEIIICATHALG